MNPRSIAIDPADAPRVRLPWFWPVLTIGAMLVLGMVVAGVNQNILYLSMLSALLVTLALFIRTWTVAMIALFGCIYFSAVEADFTHLTFLDPAPHDARGGSWATPIDPSQAWHYHFNLGDLGALQAPGPLEAFLCVDGHNLKGLLIALQGRTINAAAYCHPELPVDHIAIPLYPNIGSSLDVSLSGMPGHKPAIYIGPEVSRTHVYSDAVWLEFTRDGERFIYHAQRRVDTKATH